MAIKKLIIRGSGSGKKGVDTKRNAEELDIKRISDSIAKLGRGAVTVWHCCTSNGKGYYTVSNGEKKLFVPSSYVLTPIGGCWSFEVYKRLYLGQTDLLRFLTRISQRISAKMPIKCLYIPYIIKEENRFCGSESEAVKDYQRTFSERYAEQIRLYSEMREKGYGVFDYYNGIDNNEYSYVEDVLEKAISSIYQYREKLEACDCWSHARHIIKEINSMSR